MKRLALILPIFLVAILAIALIAPGFIDWNKYKPQVQEQVKKASGLDIDLAGNVSFAVLPFPKLSIENVSISNPSAESSNKIASFDRLDIAVALAPLLSQEIQVKSLTLVKPEITLAMLESGKLNVMSPEIEALTAAKDGQGEASKLPAISLDKITIKDGTFLWNDAQSGSEQKIENINADITAKTLIGPFALNGSIFHAGRAIDLSIKAENLDIETKTISIRSEITLKPDDIELTYAGALNFANGIKAQGPLSLRTKSIPQMLASNKIDNPGFADIAFEGKGILSADTEKVILKDFELGLGEAKLAGQFTVSLKGMNVDASLKTLNPLKVNEVYPGASAWVQTASINMAASGTLNKINLQKSSFDLDSSQYEVSGSYEAKGKNERPVLTANIETDTLDYDRLSKSMPQQKSAVTLEDSLKNIKFPLDVNFFLLIKKMKYQGQDLSGISAKIAGRENSISITDLAVKNYMGSAINATVEVGNIATLSNITANISFSSADIKTLMQAYQIDTKSLPKGLSNIDAKAKMTGSASQMNVTANINALGAEIITQGALGTPFTSPTASNLEVQVKHQNLAKGLEALTGTPVQDTSLSQPIDLYTKVSQIGKSYKLEDIKGKLAGTTMQGTVLLDMSHTKPSIKGDLNFDKLVLNTIVNKTAKNTPAGKGSERWSKEPISTGGLHTVNLDISLSATSIDYGPWPLQQPKAKIELKDGTLSIPNLTAGLFDGQIEVATTISAAEKDRQPLHIDGNAKLSNVSVGKLVKALSGTQLIKASGTASVETTIKTSGSSPAALVYDLSGQGTVTGSNIVLEGVDITRFARALSEESKPGDTALGLWKGVSKGGSTAFDTLDGNYQISEGIVNINKMDLDGPAAAIATTGNVNLPLWTLSTKHKITVKNRDDVPPFEVAFSGSIDNPGQTFGQGLLQDYLKRKVSRKMQSILSDKLGLPGQEKQPPQNVEPAGNEATDSAQQNSTEQAPPQQNEPLQEIEPEEAIKGLLKGLLQ